MNKVVEVWMESRCIYIEVNNADELELEFDSLLKLGTNGIFKLEDVNGKKYTIPVRSVMYYMIRNSEQ